MKNSVDPSEYGPYYATYVKQVPEGDIIEILSCQLNEAVSQIQELTEDEALYRYLPGKWSVKEVIGHIIDTERIMAYRLLAIARGETVALPGFDEQNYVKNADFDRLTLQELVEHFTIVRQSTIQLLKSLPSDAWKKSGNANGLQVTVRGLALIIAGHELHHRKIISDRYVRKM